MTVQKFLFILFLGCGALALNAQEPTSVATSGSASIYSPADKWELGIHAGVPFLIGDIDPNLGFGGGLHLRKSLDHVFSVRGSAFYFDASGENTGSSDNRKYDTNMYGGSGDVVITLNNLRFNRPTRRILLNAFAGVGVEKFETTYSNIDNGGEANPYKSNINGFAEGGAGIQFRVSPRFNIALEHTVIASFGQGADLIDGDNNTRNGRSNTSYRDILQYPHFSLNFNLGGKTSAKSEPLYWVNPMTGYNDAIANLEARPVYDPSDSDGDGIIDAIDQEKDSPAGARVDTRGVTMDSDGDGIADFKDKEPYSPPGYKIDGMGVAQIPVEKKLTEDDVTRIVDAKLANFKLPAQRTLVDWFLPMIHYDLDRYSIKRSEYVKLHQVASVLKQNPDVRVAVMGYTDKSASDRYNNVLSYNRAKAAIDFLVENHGIARDRLVLTWGGENTTIVNTNSPNYINRRVEFKVATTETEMGRPEGPNAGSGPRFNGNRDAGY